VKFTLKDYQEQAVDDVLQNLKRARENFKNPSKREKSSFSLTATTGAGKTVMEQDTLTMLRNVCVEAGLKDPKVAGPWVRIQTRLGEIEMGWRKNVMSIDWSDIVTKKTHGMEYTEQREASKALEAETLFPNENVTRSGHSIHAWSTAKASEYLRVFLQKVGLV
jgi:hypothetical protein